MNKLGDVENLISLFRSMQRIRMFEDTVSAIYRDGDIPGFVHCYQGEEAVAAGVCAHLLKGDVITSTHRGHGHVLAKGGTSREMMAELYGKVGGCSGGRGGSMHAYNLDYGLLGTNGMVGGGLGLATGAGFAQKYKGTKNVAVSFFGDGASNMGIFYESLNLASRMVVPVIFVCENNLFATSTPLEKVAANPEIATRAISFNMPGVAVNGSDVIEIYDVAGKAIERARNGDGPTLIEAKTYRYHGHHEGDQVYGTYRTRQDVEAWMEKDPIETLKQKIIENYHINKDIFQEIESELMEEMKDAVRFAQESPLPEPDTVFNNVFFGETNKCQ